MKVRRCSGKGTIPGFPLAGEAYELDLGVPSATLVSSFDLQTMTAETLMTPRITSDPDLYLQLTDTFVDAFRRDGGSFVRGTVIDSVDLVRAFPARDRLLYVDEGEVRMRRIVIGLNTP